MNWHVKRTGQALFTLWAVVTLAFLLTRQMPGDQIDAYVNQVLRNQPNANPEAVRNSIADQLMIDPEAGFFEAYATYLGELLSGNLGYSIEVQQSVNKLIAETVPWTLFIMALATFGLFGISLALGAIMAYKEGSAFDLSNTLLGMFTTSIPYYVVGILLIIYIGYDDGMITQYFPTRHKLPDGVDPGFTLEFVSGALRHATLPALSYVFTAYGLLALSMRANSIQVLGEDYVRVAQLRGLPDRRIALRYVGRNAILPLYTTLLLSVGFMLGGSVILEQIFNYQGIGFWMDRSVQNNDVPLMMGIFLVITTCVIIATYIADLTYGMLDPRIKSGDEGEAY